MRYTRDDNTDDKKTFLLHPCRRKTVSVQRRLQNFTSAEPNTYLGRPKLLSSTVDSDGRTLHVPNLIRGEKKYHPYCLK